MKAFRDEFIREFSKLFRKLGAKNPKLETFLLGTYFDGLVLNFIAAEADFSVEEIKNALLSKYIENSHPKSKRKSG